MVYGPVADSGMGNGAKAVGWAMAHRMAPMASTVGGIEIVM